MEEPLRTFATSAVKKPLTAVHRTAPYLLYFLLFNSHLFWPAPPAASAFIVAVPPPLRIFHRRGRGYAVIQVFHLIRYLRP
jgi:hypothetical protein